MTSAILLAATFLLLDAPAEPAPPRVRRVAVVVYDGVELLDLAGPYEVFTMAAGHAGRPGAPAYEVIAVGVSKEPVHSLGLTLTPDHDLDDCPTPDIIVVPGGSTRGVAENPRFQTWLKEKAPGCEVVLSVCTGARALATVGLLDGKEATTHWGFISALEEIAPATTVLRDRRFVDAGQVVTAAGVSAGIDGALHVVARIHGLDTALATARSMQYEWRPDPRSVPSYPPENPEIDPIERRRLRARSLTAEGDWKSAERLLREAVAEDPGATACWRLLGWVLRKTGRDEEAIPVYEHGTASPTDAGACYFNLAEIHAAAGRDEQALDALEQFAAAGYPRARSHVNQSSALRRLETHDRYRAVMKRLDAD